MEERSDEDLKKLIEEKANFFCSAELPVHIVFKNLRFENGTIAYCGTDFFLLKYFSKSAEINKKQSDYIFFRELVDIEEYREEE
jgi:hypothetical protein